ncbi:MAG: DUF1553 domain-containing protein [Acidimicrobiia bacterium]|nr:DUF1553 domain-containing protein [Acidimicrobiia bacterium]
MRILAPISVGLLFLIGPALAQGGFEDKVHPILQNRCLPCHDARTRTSGFSVAILDSVLAGGARHGRAVKNGQPSESPLIQILRGRIKPQMPLGQALAETEIVAIEEWIRTLKPESATTPAAAKGGYWAFLKPTPQAPPSVKNSRWVRNDIDAFILNRLEANSLTPPPEADRKVLVRRLYFDLIGLPPTPQEVRAFVESNSPKAYEELVERLLGDKRYGERWGRHWLDLARYADTNGYEGDPEFAHAWRYRDYVIDAFNNDKPYDEFIKEQIAGDELAPVMSAGPLPPPEPEKVVALTFLRLAPFTEPRGEESRDLLLSEMTSTVSSVFLGLTVGCAKCHDHKYDMVPTRDFYRMKAFFATVQIEPARVGDVQQLGGPLRAEFYRPGEKEWADKARAGFEEELRTIEKDFAVFQKPLLEKLTARRRREKPTGDASAQAEVTLKDLKKEISDEGDNSAGFQKKEPVFSQVEKQQFQKFEGQVLRLKKKIERLEPAAMSLRHSDGPPYGPSVPTTHVLIRGEYDRPGEPVEPGFLSAITGNSDPAVIEIDRYKRHPTRGRRLALAKWIASSENPLTARVMVNRLWQHHFGRGIVDTPSDFGKNGSPPTHPELLDWLATRFVEGKWSVKAMHRLILASNTYRQSSQNIDAKAMQSDPDNRLLWRFNRLRLEGEVIRDSVLAVSGRLNPERGGPPVFPPLPKGLDEAQKVQGINTWETSNGGDGRKRSVYVFQRRSLNLPLLETFDASVFNASCDRRRTSITALQPLSMYNGEFANLEARHFAEVLQKVGSNLDAQIQQGFWLALARSPTAAELKRLSAFLDSVGSKEEALIGLCRILLNTNEFVYVD